MLKKYPSSLAIPLLSALLMTACGGGGGSSDSTSTDTDSGDSSSTSEPLTTTEAENLFSQDLTDTQTGTAVRLSFSPPADYVCDLYGTNATTGKQECIAFVTDASEALCDTPSGDYGESAVDLYLALMLDTQENMNTAAANCRTAAVFGPVLLTEGPVDFGSHDSVNDYTAQGQVCFRADDLSNLTAVATLSGTDLETTTLDLVNDVEGCFQLPDVRALAIGLYDITVEATDSVNVTGGTDETVGTVQIVAFENSVPVVTITLNDADYLLSNNNIRDINETITPTSTATDTEDGDIPATDQWIEYRTTGGDWQTAIDSAVPVSDLGGQDVELRAGARDSQQAVGYSETLMRSIDLDDPLVSANNVGNYSCNVGESVTVPSASFSDADDDVSVSQNIVGSFSCASVGTATISISASSRSGSLSYSRTITVSAPCPPPFELIGGVCQ